jgi:hypothetical protein
MSTGGSALKLAADEVVAKGRRLSAWMLEVSEPDIVFEQGVFRVCYVSAVIPGRNGIVFVSVSSVIVKQRDGRREIQAVANQGDRLHEGLRSGAPAPPGSYTAGS